MSENDFGRFPKRETSEVEDHHELLQDESLDLQVIPGIGEISGLKLVKHETLSKQDLNENGSCEMPIGGKELSNGRDSNMEIMDVEKDALVRKLVVRPFAFLAESMLQANQASGDFYSDSNIAAVASHSSSALPSLASENTIIISEASSQLKEEVDVLAVNTTPSHSHTFETIITPSETRSRIKEEVDTLALDIPSHSLAFEAIIVPSEASCHIKEEVDPLAVNTTPSHSLAFETIITPSEPSSSIKEEIDSLTLNTPSNLFALETTIISSETSSHVKEEVGSSAVNTSLHSLAFETFIIPSEASSHIKEEVVELGKTSNTNVIVKPELDLDVPGDSSEQSSKNTWNNSTKGRMMKELLIKTSTSICRSKKNLVVEPFHGIKRNDLLPRAKLTGKVLCKVCDYRHDDAETIAIHTAKLHTEKYNYRCFICAAAAYKHKISPYNLESYQFHSYRALEYHVAIDHRREKRFMCSICDRHFKTKPSLRSHEARAHQIKPIKPFACQHCFYTCTTSSVLEKHVSLVHNETPAECSICSKIIKQSNMKAHLRGHERKSDPQFQRKCGKCDFVTTANTLLRKHFRQTSHHLEHHCHYCKKFASNSEEDFKMHTRSCRPYFCTFQDCDKVFYVEREFITHVRLHSVPPEKVHACVEEACDFQTKVKQVLIRHYKKTKHNQPCQCPHCPARYSVAECVTNHILKAHVEQIGHQSDGTVEN